MPTNQLQCTPIDQRRHMPTDQRGTPCWRGAYTLRTILASGHTMTDSAQISTRHPSARRKPMVANRLKLVVAASIVAVALAASLVPGSACADGDPASDVLVTQTLFLPWDAGVSADQQAQLAALLKEAEHDGYQLRVALIASAADLGSVTELWRQPQSYAEFLGEELSLVYKGTLLVIMPDGFGLYRLNGSHGPEQAALASMRSAVAGASLGSAALLAIQHLAAAAGHRLNIPHGISAPTAASGSSNAVAWIVFVISGALIALAWAGSLRAQPLRVRLRRGSAPST